MAAEVAAPQAPSHGLSASQVEACMRASAAWPQDANKIVWVSEHDALRADMDDLAAAIGALDSQLAAGKALTAWQVATLGDAWAQFEHFVEHHHINEEGIFFPWIETREKLPPKLTADHKTLMAMLGACATSVAAMRTAGPATSAATVRALREAYGPLHTGASAHFKEEEDVSVPLMRHHFSAKELKAVEAKMLKDVTPDGMAWVVRPLATPAAKSEWMTHVAGVAAPGQVMMPAVRQRDARYVSPMKALCAGATEAPPPPQEGCACSVM